MTYFAYVRTNDTLRLDYAGRDEERGIIGTVHDVPEPIAECESLDAAVAAGYAHIGQNPTASVYVTDANALLHKMLLCHPHHEQVSALHKHLFVAWTCIASLLYRFLRLLFLAWDPRGLHSPHSRLAYTY